MEMYNGYHFGGMHFIWWILWMIILIWVFATPYNIPGQRKKKDSPLHILQKRLASGEITSEQHHEKRKLIDKN
jgi:putative membrane protein